ncbi:hypothetical protein ACIBAH_29020 [Streptomyces sp. NPDC051445]|uniref:hypothetical protein n=1 Tax=Streptomyces sp. NPDC051445 TaxID=3365653 RepID=UPI0037AD3D16
MPVHLTPPQLTALTVLAVASVAWLMFMTRMLRRSRSGDGVRPAPLAPPVLPALPCQRQSGPRLEAVELTPAEKDAFAGLVRQLGGGR